MQLSCIIRRFPNKQAVDRNHAFKPPARVPSLGPPEAQPLEELGVAGTRRGTAKSDRRAPERQSPNISAGATPSGAAPNFNKFPCLLKRCVGAPYSFRPPNRIRMQMTRRDASIAARIDAPAQVAVSSGSEGAATRQKPCCPPSPSSAPLLIEPSPPRIRSPVRRG